MSRMAGLIAKAMQAAIGTHGVTVNYRRGTESIAINAVLGRAESQATGEYTVSTVYSDLDFLIRRADLAIFDCEPQAGDKIAMVDGNQRTIYEVARLGDQPCFATDPHNVTLRIHTTLCERDR